jgi:hypothetical protein
MEWIVLWLVAVVAILGAIAGRSYERNRWHERLVERAGLGLDEPKRLTESLASVRTSAQPETAQLAQAIEAIAVEVERIGEGQRFLTRVLAERDQRASVAKVSSPIPGSIRSPIPPTSQ